MIQFSVVVVVLMVCEPDQDAVGRLRDCIVNEMKCQLMKYCCSYGIVSGAQWK